MLPEHGPADPEADRKRDTIDGGPSRRGETVAAFLLAPGLAALAGGGVVALASLCSRPFGGLDAMLGAALYTFCFALVGYPTTVVVGIPVYLLSPERARSDVAVVVPVAGAVATSPFLLLFQASTAAGVECVVLLVPFALGCVAGLAFWAMGRPRAAAFPIAPLASRLAPPYAADP